MSNNQRFRNIVNYFNSEEDDNEKEGKNKNENTKYNKQNKNKDYSSDKKDCNNINSEITQLQSQRKYNIKAPRNSKDENILENININYFDNIPMNSDREINEFNDNIQENNKDNVKNSLNNNINNSKSNSQEKEISLLDSFRPREEPNSPEFIKKSSEFNYHNSEISEKNKNNNFNNNNYVDNNFSQTLETKIISNNQNKKNQKQENLITVDNIINGNKSNNNHNNIVSIGTFASKEIEDNYSKTSEELEKQKEEEFLMKEDLKIKKFKNQIKEEENGKENVIDDDDEEDNQNNDEINNNFTQPKFSRNFQNNNMYNSETQTTMPKRIKDMSKKLFQAQDKINNDNNVNINYINNPDTENGKNIVGTNYNIIKQEEKYETDSSKINTLNKLDNRIPVVKKTGIKYNKNNSPSVKNINININNNNFNSEFKDSAISSFNIYSNKNNLMSNRGVYSKKNVLQKDLKNIKKKLIYSGKNPKRNEKKFQIRKEGIISKTPIKQKKSENKKDKFTFTPLINKKSRKMWEKRNEKLEEMKSPEKDTNSISNSNSNKKNKKPIYILLNELGNKQREKMKQICLTEKNNIKLNANIKKTNENCYNMYKRGMNKQLDNIFKKYVKDDELSIINIVQCLCTMRIINELIKFEHINDLSLTMLKTAVKNVKDNDNKKLEELELIEQLWFIINPSLKESINSKFFCYLVKKLYICDNPKIKNLCEEIEQELEENKDENNKENIYISPLRDKTFEATEIWPLKKLIKTFLKLKSDLKAYKNNYYLLKKENLKNDLTEERDKELTFEPDLSKSNYVFKNPKYEDYNIKNDDLNKSYTNISGIRKTNFNKIYERMMNEKKMQEEILKTMKLIKEVKEKKKCTSKPQILKYKSKRAAYIQNRMNKSVDITNINQRRKIPIYERLYSLRKIYNQKKIKVDDNNEETEERFNSKRSFDEKNHKFKNKNKSKNQIVEKIEINNYDTKNKNSNNKNMNNAQIYSRKIQKMKIKNTNNNLKENGNNNIIDNIYVIIEIKTPNGEKKPIKIYKNQNDINEIVEKFCKDNKINNENKDIIYNKVTYYHDNIFGRNTYKNNFTKFNFEDNLFSEYRETKTNTNN